LKDISLMNLENREQKPILKSMNNDINLINHTFIRRQSFVEDETLSLQRETNQKNMFRDPENEEHMDQQIVDDILDADDYLLNDFFFDACIMQAPDEKKIEINLRQTQLDVNDGIFRKVYDTVLAEMPESSPSKYGHLKEQTAVKESVPKSEIVFKWQGLIASFRDKKDIFIVKIFNMMAKVTKSPELSELQVSLKNFMII
jgi:hypothetical protein